MSYVRQMLISNYEHEIKLSHEQLQITFHPWIRARDQSDTTPEIYIYFLALETKIPHIFFNILVFYG